MVIRKMEIIKIIEKTKLSKKQVSLIKKIFEDYDIQKEYIGCMEYYHIVLDKGQILHGSDLKKLFDNGLYAYISQRFSDNISDDYKYLDIGICPQIY